MRPAFPVVSPTSIQTVRPPTSPTRPLEQQPASSRIRWRNGGRSSRRPTRSWSVWAARSPTTTPSAGTTEAVTNCSRRPCSVARSPPPRGRSIRRVSSIRAFSSIPSTGPLASGARAARSGSALRDGGDVDAEGLLQPLHGKAGGDVDQAGNHRDQPLVDPVIVGDVLDDDLQQIVEFAAYPVAFDDLGDVAHRHGEGAQPLAVVAADPDADERGHAQSHAGRVDHRDPTLDHALRLE